MPATMTALLFTHLSFLFKRNFKKQNRLFLYLFRPVHFAILSEKIISWHQETGEAISMGFSNVFLIS
jgi:hypothetical protein